YSRGNRMKDSFNSDFYITAATVIPVLYLALTLQGSTLEELFRNWRRNLRPADEQRNPKSEFRMEVISGAAIFGAIFMLNGIVGEFIAVLALYHRNSGPESELYVLSSMVFLLVLIAAGPLIKFLVTWVETARDPAWKSEKNPKNPGQETAESNLDKPEDRSN